MSGPDFGPMSGSEPGLMPAEWEPHAACWLAFPHLADEWSGVLEAAQAEFIQLCRSIAGERVELLVPDTATVERLTPAFADHRVTLHVASYGDSWTRDTAPLFVRAGAELVAMCFQFNGWGGKYDMPGDRDVSRWIAAQSGVRAISVPWVMEGGSIDVDGDGTLLTTRQCLLNPNRNPGLDEAAVAAVLAHTVGATRILWLDDGLVNDHTDGHIDTLARFVAPGVVVCMEPSGADDPNAPVLEDIARTLASFVDARGRRLEVVRIPSPGRCLAPDGEILPASYCNFYVANRSVVVPVYGTPWDDEAVERIAALFPGRRTHAVSAQAILRGGGAFHCMTQQQPEPT